jgi:hypothetical protein
MAYVEALCRTPMCIVIQFQLTMSYHERTLCVLYAACKGHVLS